MILARVTGTVVMTVKHQAFHGEKLMTVEPLDVHGKPTGGGFLAIDRAQAGPGDTVLVLREGSGIRQIIGRETDLPIEMAVTRDIPVRSMIVGIVDAVSTTEKA